MPLSAEPGQSPPDWSLPKFCSHHPIVSAPSRVHYGKLRGKGWQHHSITREQQGRVLFLKMISWFCFLPHLIKIVIVIRTVSATSCCKQEQLSFESTTDVVALHNCLCVLGVFNKCSFSLILAVYFCFTAAFHLTAAGSSTAALFICSTPAVFPQAQLPQSSRQFNIPCLNLSHFPPLNSPEVQGTHFSAEAILPKGSIKCFLSTAVLHLHGAGREGQEQLSDICFSLVSSCLFRIHVQRKKYRNAAFWRPSWQAKPTPNSSL